MIDLLKNYIDLLIPWQPIASLVTISIVATIVIVTTWLISFITKKYLVKFTKKALLAINAKWEQVIFQHKVVHKFSYIIPGIVLYMFGKVLEQHTVSFIHQTGHVMKILSMICMIFAITWTILALLEAINAIYSQYNIAKKLPIKTYIQVIKMLLTLLASIISISIILGTPPLTLLASLGVTTGIIIVIFKDSILSFFASIQLSAYDIIRIGDWITVASYKADGEVIELSLSTVKIRNFDKTITTIPTYNLINTGIQNWRGMQESGGRRIKRAIYIDMNSIKFIPKEEVEKYKCAHLLTSYVKEQLSKEPQINSKEIGSNNNLTNLGLFRAYAIEYLRNNPNLHTDGFTFLVRLLQPTERGLPIELYVFANDIRWKNYEEIQADIFEHLLAILPSFDLRVFQRS